ncbi:ChaB family protein [Massilia sp. DD77]|uniref:ChaB family protein n=1 Tax=Massilia sp. DD77 TaxID=3109349 RepID=UPI002FFFF1A8
MPYRSIFELPPKVRANLPQYAHETYQQVFNEAWDQYADRGEAREQSAHLLAWKTAVKRKYRKNEETGDWEPAG